MKEIHARDLDEYISTNHEANMAIMREINRIGRKKKTKVLLTGCALMLRSVGVDFSKMSYGNICKHCQGYEEHHDENGKREGCPGFELFVDEELQKWMQ